MWNCVHATALPRCLEAVAPTSVTKRHLREALSFASIKSGDAIVPTAKEDSLVSLRTWRVGVS